MKEEKILLAGIRDKWRKCREYYMTTSTGFLDLHQRSLAEGLCRELEREDGEIRHIFYGGYEDAERTVLVFLPDYADLEEENPLAAVRMRRKPGGKAPAHGDYLGSLMGLGLKREAVGDILVSSKGADIIVQAEIRDFLLTHYDKAGRTNLSPEAIGLNELEIPEMRVQEYRDTVASLRLDSMVASAFSMSRGMAAEAVKSGIVFVNHVQADKVSMTVKEGDQLVCRGKGKVLFESVDGKTRKDRFVVVMKKYK